MQPSPVFTGIGTTGTLLIHWHPMATPCSSGMSWQPGWLLSLCLRWVFSNSSFISLGVMKSLGVMRMYVAGTFHTKTDFLKYHGHILWPLFHLCPSLHCWNFPRKVSESFSNQAAIVGPTFSILGLWFITFRRNAVFPPPLPEVPRHPVCDVLFTSPPGRCRCSQSVWKTLKVHSCCLCVCQVALLKRWFLKSQSRHTKSCLPGNCLHCVSVEIYQLFSFRLLGNSVFL